MQDEVDDIEYLRICLFRQFEDQNLVKDLFEILDREIVLMPSAKVRRVSTLYQSRRHHTYCVVTGHATYTAETGHCAYICVTIAIEHIPKLGR